MEEPLEVDVSVPCVTTHAASVLSELRSPAWLEVSVVATAMGYARSQICAFFCCKGKKREIQMALETLQMRTSVSLPKYYESH